jgi:hypothetical protein
MRSTKRPVRFTAKPCTDGREREGRMYLESKVQVAARVILGLDVDSDGLLPHGAATLMKYKRLELGHRLFAGARAEAVIDRVAVVVADAHQELSHG